MDPAPEASAPDGRRYRGAVELVQALASRGFRTLLVGGWVRDVRVLGLEADRDIDIATAARPEEVRRAFPRTAGVGQAFGVVLVMHRGETYEVATFRRDEGAGDGRRPGGVSYTDDPRQDALRRDFTANGLFFDPATGEVLDYVGGVRDIRERRLRAIGDPERRFAEDHLRVLRAVRFAAQLGFSLEEGTEEAARAAAPCLVRISAERIRQELVETLAPPRGGEGLALLARLGALAVILPEVEALRGLPQPPAFHPEGDVFTHTCLTLARLDRGGEALVMAALLHDAGKAETYEVRDRIRFHGHARASARITGEVMTRLRFPKAETRRAVELVRRHMDFLNIDRMRPATLKRFLRVPDVEDHLALHRADCLASHGDLGHLRFARRKLAEFTREDLRPPPLLTGHDLIAEGYEPGPSFGRILAQVEEAQLDGRIATREEALALARRLAAEEEA